MESTKLFKVSSVLAFSLVLGIAGCKKSDDQTAQNGQPQDQTAQAGQDQGDPANANLAPVPDTTTQQAAAAPAPAPSGSDTSGVAPAPRLPPCSERR